jgi:hypothetical protein
MTRYMVRPDVWIDSGSTKAAKSIDDSRLPETGQGCGPDLARMQHRGDEPALAAKIARAQSGREHLAVHAR